MARTAGDSSNSFVSSGVGTDEDTDMFSSVSSCVSSSPEHIDDDDSVPVGFFALLGNCVFIFGGKWMVQRIANSQQYLNWVIGGIFTLTALIQLVKMLRKKDAVSKFSEEN